MEPSAPQPQPCAPVPASSVPGSSSGPADAITSLVPAAQQQLQGSEPLTAQTLQQLEQQRSFELPQHAPAPQQQPPANPPVWHAEVGHGVPLAPGLPRSPLGQAVAAFRKDSASSTCSSAALLGRMSGVSLPRPESGLGPAQQPHLPAQQTPEQQAAQHHGQAAVPVPTVPGGGLLLVTVAPAGASTSSSPTLRSRTNSMQQTAIDMGGLPHAAPAGQDSAAAAAAAAAAASSLPVAPEALGLPPITTTQPVPIPGSSSPGAAGVSPHGGHSAVPGGGSPSITQQNSLGAVPLALLAAAQVQAVQQHQQQQQQQLQAPSVGTMDSDNSLDSSSDDDDNYEFGEQKIKKTFSRQQRRQRRQQVLLAQQQQQLLLQQQQQQAELQAQLLQQAVMLSRPLSPSTQGGSPLSPSRAAAAAAAGSMHFHAAVIRSSPPGTPKDVTSTSLGSGQAVVGAVGPSNIITPLQLQQLIAAQQQAAEPLVHTATSASPLQQQEHDVSSPVCTASPAATGLQPPDVVCVEWGTAVPQAAAGAAAAVATSAGGEPSFMPALEHTLSGTSAASAVSGKSGSRAAGATPVVGSAGGAGAAGAVRPQSPTLTGSAGAGVCDIRTCSLGGVQASGLQGGSIGGAVSGSGPSFLARLQGLAGSGGGGGAEAVVPAGGSGGGGAGAGAGAGDAAKKEQSELTQEFQGLSLFNEEDDDDEGEGDEERPRWYKRPMVWLRIVAFGMSAVLLLMGILTQNVPAMSRVNNSGVELFRWFYFFSLWPILWVIVSLLNNRLFAFVEWWFYREALCSYLDSVRRTARGLIFMCLVLPWFTTVFWEAWCDGDKCNAESAYKKATDIVWKLMVCLTLFSLANFLKSVLTKLLSSHFYRSAHFKKVKDAIEKEYWLLMLSQPRPPPKPASEPPLSRLSHYIHVNNGNSAAGAEAQRNGLDGQGPGSQNADQLVDTMYPSGKGGTFKLRRRYKSSRTSAEIPKPHMLPQLAASSVNFFSRRDSRPAVPARAESCGALGTSASTAAAAAAAAPTALPALSSSQQVAPADGALPHEHELTLSQLSAAQLATLSPGSLTPLGANGQLSPDFTARIMVSGFNIEAEDLARTSPQLDASPSSFTAVQGLPQGAAGSGSQARGPADSRVGSLSSQLHLPAQPQQYGSGLEQSRSSSLKWQQEGNVDAATSRAPAAAASGCGDAVSCARGCSDVDLQPFKAGADRAHLLSGSDAEADDKAGQHGLRWGFWRRSASDKQALLPAGHSPSSPGSQHTLVIQDAAKPVEGSGGSRQFSGMLSSVFASPAAQQQHMAISTLNSGVSRKAGSTSAAVQRPSTDMAGPGSTSNAAEGGAAAGRTAAAAAAVPATNPAAGLSSDPLLQPGVLEAVNLKVDGKAVDTSTIRPAEWERLRAGIALKTFTALMKRYHNLTDAEEAKKLRDARRFAKGLFYHVRGTNARPYVVRDDFTPFFGSKESADAAFGYFDKDNDATLSLKEMKDSVVAIFKERKNMAASLKDTDSIVNTLEFGIGCLLHFVFAAIYLLVWGLDIVKGFSTFSATVLALTFVFGNSVRQIYESMLFIFVEHAFDVGDLLEVETIAYRVKKIDLMYTVLVKSTGERCYYPNVRLITLPVINLTRSCARSEKVVISLDIGRASNAAREALLAAVKEHYEENESDFNSCPSVNFVNLVDPFKVQLSVTWTYNFGADESKRTSLVKTALLQVVHSCLGTLPGLEYTLVRDMNGTGGEGGDGKERSATMASLGAGVAEQQAAKAATMGAAMMGGTAMMGATAGLALL